MVVFCFLASLFCRHFARVFSTRAKPIDLRREAGALKEVVAELTLENRLLKKSVTADGEDAA
jgi:hypothetical protein